MTNEERDALIERARKILWLDAMKRRENEALLAALDEARGYAQQLTRRVERGNAIAQRREEELQRERDEARRMLDRMADESHVFNTILESTQRERDEARAHLAALREAYVNTDLATAAREHEQSIRADERARGLEDAAYLTASVSDAEVFRAQAARLRGTVVGSPVRRPLAGVPTPPLGERASVIARVEDHDHHLVIAMYRFHDGTERPYVEVHESHNPPGPARVLPLPEAVHLMQNVSLDELHSIGGREVGVLYGADSTHETARARSRAVLYPVHGIGAEVPYDADEADEAERGTR